MRLFPIAAADSATRVDLIFGAWCLLCGTTAVVLLGLFVFFAVKYRDGSRADRTPAKIPTRLLEVSWTVLPLFPLLAMFAWAAWAYDVDQQPPRDADEIYVTGKQWMWKVQHPGGQRELNALHVPVDRPVKLILTSQDVIHSLFLPAFRLKQDVLPGRVTTMWFRATRVGTYRLTCAEFCGTDHALMGGDLVVLGQPDYQRWLRQTRTGPDLAKQGEALFRSAGCTGCHGPAATVHAPKLDGIFGRPQPLTRGGFRVADEAYIRDAILQPAKDVVAGYQPIMPSFQGQLDEGEVQALTAYLRSLP